MASSRNTEKGRKAQKGGHVQKGSKMTHAKRRSQRRRRGIIIGVEVVLLIILAACCYVVNMMGLLDHQKVNKEDIYIPSYQNNAEEVLEGYRNIAIVGVDTRSSGELKDEKNGDVLIVASINNKTKDVKLVSLYRDTYLKMADTKGKNKEYQKANFQMQIGDAVDTMNMMNMNMDLDIQDYVVVNWGAVAKAIDLLGGIDDVEITEELIEQGKFNGYVTDVVKNTGIAGQQIWEPGVYTLTGTQAVAYCRIRFVGYDYQRTERQREVITKMLGKAKDNIGVVPEVIKTVFPNISTNMDMMEILGLAADVFSYNIVDQTGFPFEPHTEEDGLIGNIEIKDPVVTKDLEKEVQKLHKFLFDVDDYEVSGKVKEISDYIKDISGLG